MNESSVKIATEGLSNNRSKNLWGEEKSATERDVKYSGKWEGKFDTHTGRGTEGINNEEN